MASHAYLSNRSRGDDEFGNPVRDTPRAKIYNMSYLGLPFIPLNATGRSSRPGGGVSESSTGVPNEAQICWTSTPHGKAWLVCMNESVADSDQAVT